MAKPTDDNVQSSVEADVAKYLQNRRREQEAIERRFAERFQRLRSHISAEQLQSLRGTLERLPTTGRTDEMLVHAIEATHGEIVKNAFVASGLNLEDVA